MFKRVAEFFADWKDHGEEIPSACDAVVDGAFGEVTLPFNVCDENRICVNHTRNEVSLNIAREEAGAWGVEASLLDGALGLEFGSDLSSGWSLNLSSAEGLAQGILCTEDSTVGSCHWSANFGSADEVDLGLKVGPMGLKTTLLNPFLAGGGGSADPIVSAECSTVFALGTGAHEENDDEDVLIAGVKQEGDDASFFGAYGSPGNDLMVALAKDMNSPATEFSIQSGFENFGPLPTGDFSAGIHVKTDNIKEITDNFDATITVSKDLDWLSEDAPINIRAGADTNQRIGFSVGMAFGEGKGVSLSMDKEVNGKPLFGLVIDC